MRIKIDVAAAQNLQAHGWLDRLLNYFEDKWHIWDVTGLEEYEKTRWVTERGTKGNQVMEIFHYSVKRSGWSSGLLHKRCIVITDEPVGAEELTPENGARFAGEKLVVLVENRKSDGDFLRRAVFELDSAIHRWFLLEPPPVRFDSVGGKGQMKEEVKKRASLCPRPRFVVVVDSDRNGPGDQPSLEAHRLKKDCDELGFPCWVLAKREAENYLPRDLLELRQNAGTEHRERIEAWDHLSDDQKDYYDMKNGFSPEPGRSEGKLFETVSKIDREILSQGFGDQVDKCWKEHRGNCNKALRERGRGDLETGVALIGREV